jgi:hypothetical protein
MRNELGTFALYNKITEYSEKSKKIFAEEGTDYLSSHLKPINNIRLVDET